MTPKPATILIVDDDADTCANLADILGDLGYRVDTAQSGTAALALVRGRHYDVALLDYKMPGMDGLTLYRELKKLSAGTVAIVVTAYASAATTEEALHAGAWQVLAKPVDFPRLLQLLGEAVDQPLVLIVDDDPELCATLWDLFREQGYRVHLARDEREAQERLRDVAFQVVLIDMKLPAGDGAGVFQLIRQTNPQARAIVITGHRPEMNAKIDELVAAGVDAVCYKPFDVAQLLMTLERLTSS